MTELERLIAFYDALAEKAHDDYRRHSFAIRAWRGREAWLKCGAFSMMANDLRKLQAIKPQP